MIDDHRNEPGSKIKQFQVNSNPNSPFAYPVKERRGVATLSFHTDVMKKAIKELAPTGKNDQYATYVRE
jgi:hypothetical protein